MRILVAAALAFAACDDTGSVQDLAVPVPDLSVPDLGNRDAGVADLAMPSDFQFPNIDCGPPLTTSGVVTCNGHACTNGCGLKQIGCTTPLDYQCCAGDGGCSLQHPEAIMCGNSSECSPLVCGASGCCGSMSVYQAAGCHSWRFGSTCSNNCEAFYQYSTTDNQTSNETLTTKLCASNADCGSPMVVGSKTVSRTTSRWENADHCCRFAALPGFGFCMPADTQSWGTGSSFTLSGVTCD